MIDPALERALGAIGSTFRLTRTYPSTHPAVTEGMRLVAESIAAASHVFPQSCGVGVQGLHAEGKQLLPRSAPLAELAGLLFTRGVRVLELESGVRIEHVQTLFGAATGDVPLDAPALGMIHLRVAQRGSRASARSTPVPARASTARFTGAVMLRPGELPADIAARRASQALRAVDDAPGQQAAAAELSNIAPQVLELRDPGLLAETIAALDTALLTASDDGMVAAIDAAATALTPAWVIERLAQRLGEPRVPPAERAALIRAVGAIGAVAADAAVEAYLATPAEAREPYRAAMRAAGDRALEPLTRRTDDPNPAVVAAAAEFLGLTGSPEAVPRLSELVRHGNDAVREAALLGLAEVGGRGIARFAVPALKDASPLVRTAAARAMSALADTSAAPLLIRRAREEQDEGVLAALLAAMGKAGGPGVLEALAEWAESGGLLRRRTPFVRAAAIAALGMLRVPEARALLDLYSQDREPSVRRAAEAAKQ